MDTIQPVGMASALPRSTFLYYYSRLSFFVSTFCVLYDHIYLHLSTYLRSPTIQKSDSTVTLSAVPKGTSVA